MGISSNKNGFQVFMTIAGKRFAITSTKDKEEAEAVNNQLNSLLDKIDHEYHSMQFSVYQYLYSEYSQSNRPPKNKDYMAGITKTRGYRNLAKEREERNANK